MIAKRGFQSRLLVAAALILSSLLTACSLNPKADPTRYYVLSNLADDASLLGSAGGAQAAETPGLDLRVGIRPVSFPSYLKRSRMVTRLATNELRYMETERWSEPLEEAFHYALAVDLGSLLGSGEVILHPWYSTEEPDFAVMVDVVRFERDGQGTAHLVVQWELRDAGGNLVTSEAFTAAEGADAEAIATSVQAQSRTVAALSSEIAAAIRKAAS
jgi:uncharacterized lipoprotein YmbA